ncbi:hypothetical protein BMETH_1563_1 [methanotrophic bacterial endosymbiont of Bathymodiolus sp.]|nr:hypothetical protein BMETH_1563_1 [methanotrophic bacterial endosymbiont of Bathymodiolus sp.]
MIMYVSLCLTLYFLIVFHTFLILVVTYVTPTAGVGYREKKHTSLNLMKLLGLDASYIMMKKGHCE